MKQLKEEATTRLNVEYNFKVNDMQEMLKDKDSLNKALSFSCNDLKEKIDFVEIYGEFKEYYQNYKWKKLGCKVVLKK